ncbi:MAG TPA: ArsA family ATPase [Kofleriaceae bacterium]|nr:ArsA family ATPase [Kofleriaceae bacterium]
MTRVVLVSGKGGVGKTTVAAATAVRAAALGHRTMVVSVDRAHNLGDVLGVKLGPTPIEVSPRLVALEADPQAELQRQWGVLQGYFARFFEWAGLGGAEAEEIAIFPGLEELLLLTRVAELVETGEHDLVVVDLAPTASSLRLLGFPELMAGPFGRMVKWERRFMRLMRPALRHVVDVPLPEEDLYVAIDQIAHRLANLRDLLTDPARTVVRLVSIPERVVVDETQRAFTLLALFGLTVDAVVVNRVLPPDVGGYLGRWLEIQARERARANELFAAASVTELRFQPDEVIGTGSLANAALEIYGDRDPSRALVERPPVRFETDGSATVLVMDLPHAPARTLDLRQRDDELIVTLGGWRRRLALPPSLLGREVTDARFSGGALRIQFKPRKET